MPSYLCYNIAWDVDEQDRKDIDLPKQVEVVLDDLDEDEEVDEVLCDKLSDITGFCHNGFDFKELK
jgi:hypothetical protein